MGPMLQATRGDAMAEQAVSTLSTAWVGWAARFALAAFVARPGASPSL